MLNSKKNHPNSFKILTQHDTKMIPINTLFSKTDDSNICICFMRHFDATSKNFFFRNLLK